MAKVLVLGSSGMLGSALARFLSEENFEVFESNRKGKAVVPGNRVIKFDVLSDDLEGLLNSVQGIDYCISAIGLIKQLIDENDPNSSKMAYSINTLFPQHLNEMCSKMGINVIQITTDCVFSGEEGDYFENSPHDPNDLYGLSKSEGETSGPNVMNIRCSIIGNELDSNNSLLNWFLSHPMNSVVNGYVNHMWNGVTTFHFSKIVAGIIHQSSFQEGSFHLVPGSVASKCALLETFRIPFKRGDLQVRAIDAPIPINRTLKTIFPQVNSQLWQAAGYTTPPTIQEMVIEYAYWQNEISSSSHQALN